MKMYEVKFSDDCERLYLLKDDKTEITINNCQLLKQHQIDGLRFLFKQFFKKTPGVIINFPPVCGKSTTVALFLNAVNNLLKNPVLILCNRDDEMQHWKERLIKWTDFNDDNIAVDYTNPFVKDKKIFLKKPENLNSYLRRHWSAVIIKEDFVYKEMLKLVFETDFKIWLTSTDIKKDLSMLTILYSWLYPKSKVNFIDFEPKGNNPKENLQKSIQLEAYIENIVLKKCINLKPFNTMNTSKIETETNNRKRLKNKDATGTKIKRSKKILPVDNVASSTIVQDDSVTKDKAKKDNFTIHQQVNKINDEHIPRNDENNGHDSPKLDVESFIRDQEPLQSSIQFDFDHLSRLYDKEVSRLETPSPELPITNIENVLNEQSPESLNFDSDSESNEVKHTEDKNDFSINKNIRLTDNLSLAKTNIKDIENLKSDINNIINETPIESNIDNKKKESDKSDKDIDSKISEMEERAIKKFKGSILDSIF